MKFKFTKLATLAVAGAIALGLAGTSVVPTMAQTGAYVKTMDLKLPAAEGVFKGIDPKGTTVVWWHNHTGARDEAVKAAVAQFNKENPFGITVEAISKGSYNDIFNAITAGIQTGELPEITVAYGNQAAVYQNDNALFDLDPVVKDSVVGIGSDFTTDMFTGFFESDLSPDHGNARLGFAVYRSEEVLYYNADVLKELGFSAPPKSWDEFKEQVCKFVKEGKGTDGYQIRTDASFIAAAAFAAGGDIFDAKEDKFTYDRPEVAIMPQVMQDLLKEGCVKKIVDPQAFSDQNALIASQALFYTGSSSGIPFISSGIDKAEKKFAFDIAAIPGYTDKPTTNVYGASNSVVAKGKSTEQILASWLFLRWYTEPEQQAYWAAKSNYFPVRRSTAANLADVFSAPGSGKAYESAFKLLDNTKAEPNVPVYQTVRSEASKAFNNILDGANVTDELAKLNELANALLEKARTGN